MTTIISEELKLEIVNVLKEFSTDESGDHDERFAGTLVYGQLEDTIGCAYCDGVEICGACEEFKHAENCPIMTARNLLDLIFADEEFEMEYKLDGKVISRERAEELVNGQKWLGGPPNLNIPGGANSSPGHGGWVLRWLFKPMEKQA